ncbi:MAG TPA: VanZ family protein [Clostridiales bacterium]|nr:VanZ family protein [Clostridiales bacterium]
MHKLLSWMAVILWMSLIFYLSHQPAAKSSELSTSITEVIIDTIETVAPQVKIEKGDLHYIVRKNAHFFYYLVLGILVVNALRRSGIYGYKSILLALLICILYAVSDEAHQIFIPGRSGEIRDVIIDSTGSNVGIFGYLVVSWVAGSRNRKVVRTSSKMK